jgi:phosphatidylserine/phosphatidylglycerophosphate/cardiolipin synthase-like enzyme
VSRFLLCLIPLVACTLSGPVVSAEPPRSLPPIEVYFSPGGGCTDAVLRELGAAKSSVLVQAYSFTAAPIAKALVEAHKRGVKVAVILDKSKADEKHSEAAVLVGNGVPTLIDGRHVTAHNKVMVIDGQVVITGSFNFHRHAEEENAENLLVIRDKGIAAKYTANWKAHAEHSVKFAKP